VHRGVRTAENEMNATGKDLESPAEEGESPVGESVHERAGSGVPRDTRNLVGRRGDHPPRLNTLSDR
jgi:hypothetical protein